MIKSHSNYHIHIRTDVLCSQKHVKVLVEKEFPVYASRLMCLKIKKPEYYQICRVLQRKTTNYIPTLVKSL